MAAKTDNLPINADIDLHNGGTIKYANEVIAIIAGVAAGEVDGIAGMCTSGGIGDIISRNRNVTRGIRIEMGGEEVSVDIYTIVEYGQPIQKVALEVQENVRKAIETMTGLHVVKVDVHVQGVSFEKENQERDAAIEAVKTPALEAAKPVKKKAHKAKPAQAPAEEPPVAEEPAQEAPAEPSAPEEAAEEEKPAEEQHAEDQPVPDEAPATDFQAESAAEEAPAGETPAVEPADAKPEEMAEPSEEAQAEETEPDKKRTRKPRRKA